MKLDIDQVKSYLSKISSASERTIQANVAQFFEYVRTSISSDNTRMSQFESDHKSKWTNWPEERDWEMPISIDESRSLS